MRTYTQLSREERYYISSQRARNVSFSQIARDLGRSTSTVTREFKRNLRPTGRYAAFVAHSYATARRRRSRRKSHFPPECWMIIYSLLEEKLSPEQISDRLDSLGLYKISYQSIYRVIRIDRRRGGFLFKTAESYQSVAEKDMVVSILGAFYKVKGSFPNDRLLSIIVLNSAIGKAIQSWVRTSINASLPSLNESRG